MPVNPASPTGRAQGQDAGAASALQSPGAASGASPPRPPQQPQQPEQLGQPAAAAAAPQPPQQEQGKHHKHLQRVAVGSHLEHQRLVVGLPEEGRLRAACKDDFKKFRWGQAEHGC